MVIQYVISGEKARISDKKRTVVVHVPDVTGNFIPVSSWESLVAELRGSRIRALGGFPRVTS